MRSERLRRYGSYASVFFAKLLPSATNLLTIPFLVSYLGIESYGLWGIYANIFDFGRILDLCITAIVTREIARNSLETGDDRLAIPTVITTLLAPQIGIAVFTVVAAFGMAGLVANHLINRQQLSLETVELAVAMMGIRMAADIMASFWTSVLIGLEKLQLFSNIQVFFQLLMCVTLILMARATHSIVWVLASQVGVGFVRNVLLAFAVRGAVRERFKLKIHASLLKSNVGFFGVTALAYSIGWVFVRLVGIIAMKLLTLSDYGLYMIAAQITSIFFLLVTPIYPILLPKLAKLIKLNQNTQALKLVWRAQRATIAMLAPLGVLVLSQHGYIATVLLHKKGYGEAVGVYLPWLMVGMIAFALAEHLFTLQTAHGNRTTNIRVNGSLAVGFIIAASLLLHFRADDPNRFVDILALWMVLQISAWALQSLLINRQLGTTAHPPLPEVLYTAGAVGTSFLLWRFVLELHMSFFPTLGLSAIYFGAIVMTSPDIRKLISSFRKKKGIGGKSADALS